MAWASINPATSSKHKHKNDVCSRSLVRVGSWSACDRGVSTCILF